MSYNQTNARYYCKYCNIYILDNKPNRIHHENGSKHKFNVAEALKKKKQEHFLASKSERELKETLAMMETQAQYAIESDRQVLYPGQHLPVPPPLPTSSSYRNFTQEQNQEAEPESDGIYTIRGVTYYEGKKFEHLLVPDANCEVYVDEKEEWFPVFKLQRFEMNIPNTSVVLVTFTVGYKDGEQEIFLSKIRSDQLRLVYYPVEEEKKIDENNQNNNEKNDNDTKKNEDEINKIDENTGIGGWTTVSVTVVDSKKVLEDSLKAQEELRKGTFQDKDYGIVIPESTKKIKEQEEIDEKLYKGFNISDQPTEPIFFNTENEDEVQFKKKKKIEDTNEDTKNKKIRNYRKK